MLWKYKLKQLEIKKDWDRAIKFMQFIIEENPKDLDAYLSINYLLMNLLVEEDYDRGKHDHYVKLAKKYFDQSHIKFLNNPEYLYYTGRTACMSEWYYNIEMEEVNYMINKAIKLDPENIVYKWDYYYSLDIKKFDNKEKVMQYIKLILQEDSSIVTTLKNKGSLGEYILGMMTHWAKRILKEQ